MMPIKVEVNPSSERALADGERVLADGESRCRLPEFMFTWNSALFREQFAVSCRETCQTSFFETSSGLTLSMEI